MCEHLKNQLTDEEEALRMRKNFIDIIERILPPLATTKNPTKHSKGNIHVMHQKGLGPE